jgi:hypothetical protein
MPNLVAQTSQQQALARKVQVDVLSKVDPPPGLLRRVRVSIQNEPILSSLFTPNEGGTRSVDAEVLTERLKSFYPLEDSIEKVAQYLADEYEQLGDGILLISSSTGKAIARLTSDDFYQPAPVPRDDGRMVERPVTIRPDTEAFITHWRFENDLEAKVRERVLARISQTEYLREEGDSRLLSLSRSGRRELAGQLERSIPEIFAHPNGIVRDFLEYFPLGERPHQEDEWDRVRVQPSSLVRRSIQDSLATNVKYDTLTAILSTTATSWVRCLASALLESQLKLEEDPIPLKEAITIRQAGIGLWLSEPNLAAALKGHGCRVLPAPGPDNLAVYLFEPAGILDIPEDRFGVHSREMHGRWTLESVTEATLWINPGLVRTFRIKDVSVSGVSVEVLT